VTQVLLKLGFLGDLQAAVMPDVTRRIREWKNAQLRAQGKLVEAKDDDE
jgi:hypothetical protein